MNSSSSVVATTPLVLHGLDGSNPLAFLAALGTLRLLVEHGDDAPQEWCRTTLGWTRAEGGWRAVLGLPRPIEADELTARLAAGVATMAKEPPFDARDARSLGESLRVEREHYRRVATAAQQAPFDDRPGRRWAEALAAYGSETSRTRDGECEKTSLDFTAGQQTFLGIAKAIADEVDAARLQRTLFAQWTYGDRGQSLRWDPVDEGRRYALSAINPANSAANPIRTDLGANALALAAVPLIPMVEGRSLLFLPSRRAMRWPIWSAMAAIDVVRSILAGGLWNGTGHASPTMRLAGIECIYECPVVLPSGYYRNFAPSRRVL